MRSIAFALLTGVVLAAPAPALAATAAVVGDGVVEFRAAPGEENRLVVTLTLNGDDGDVIGFAEAGAEILPGTGCEAVTASEVVCAGEFLGYADVDLGDGDDTAAIAPCAGGPFECGVLLLGGAGNDVLIGANGWDVLGGGAGNDTLEGRGGGDLMGGGSGADTFAGGGGADDDVTYDGRTAPIVANLDGLPGDGQAGEGDTIGADVEGLIGGAGDDHLTGNDAPNILVGNAGNDVLRTGLGNDYVEGDQDVCNDWEPAPETDGADVIETGAGADEVSACGGDDSIKTGSGKDRVWAGEGNDRVTAGRDEDYVSGDDGADILDGGRGADTIDGWSGNDRLSGGFGRDVLAGHWGADVVTGGPGADTLWGDGPFGSGRGNDLIIACDGTRDVVRGGRGRDRASVDRIDVVTGVEDVRCRR